jgi:hypothetical protein
MPSHDGLPCPTAFYTSARRSAYGRPVPTTWGQLRKALTSHGRDRPADKLDVPCWAPHVATGNRRTAASIESVHALVLDFDDGADVPDVMGLFPAKERCAYSTFSAEPGAPRCRLVLPLAAPVVGALWAATMRLILKDIGQDRSAADPKCIDPSRLYLLPCRGPVEVADYAPGDLIDVAEYVARAEYEAELARIAADHLRARHVARAEAARRWAEAPARDGLSDAERAERRGHAALRADPEARRRAAADLGAKIAPRDGSDVAHGLACPSCGRPDAWFVIDPRRAWGAYCNHRNSCGWFGSIGDLITAAGMQPAAYGG